MYIIIKTVINEQSVAKRTAVNIEMIWRNSYSLLIILFLSLGILVDSDWVMFLVRRQEPARPPAYHKCYIQCTSVIYFLLSNNALTAAV